MAEHGGHRRRRRALFEVTLGEGWEEARLLELALFEAIPRGDVYPLAQRLLERFGSLSAVSAAPEEELLRERGVGEKTARVLRDAPALLEEMRARAREAREAVARREAAPSGDGRPSLPPRPVLRTPEDAGLFLLPYFTEHREEALYILALDGDYTFLGIRLAGLGGEESVRVDMENLVRMSEAMGARYIIAAHNHPSGIALPSAADEQATLAFRDALREAGITLLDHIVTSTDDFVSLRENGFLP